MPANVRLHARCGLVLFSVLALVAGAGCRNESSRQTPEPEPIASVMPSASAVVAPAVSSMSPPEAALVVIPSRKVPGKTLIDGSIIGEFTFQRDAGDEGLVWLDAADHCTKSGLRLCTATQWQVACEADASIATIESWTITPERREGFVVRGGSPAGCRDNRIASGVQASPFRVAACCSPAVAAAGRKIAPAMLRAMAKNVMDLERTLNGHRASALRDFFDEPVRIFLKERTRAEAVGVFEHEFGKNPDFHVAHELCDFSADAGDNTYTADCRKIVRQSGLIGHVLTRYVFVGGSGKLRSMTDPAVYRPFVGP